MTTTHDPTVYLTRDPSDAGRTLTAQLKLHDGAAVPMWMFAESEVVQHDLAKWVDQRAAVEEKIRRRANASLGVLATAILTVLGGIAHRLVESGRAEERAVQQDRAFLDYRDSARREMDGLKEQISELRRDLRRLSGSDAPGPASDTEPTVIVDPDKLAALRLDPEQIMASAAALLFAPGPPPPSSCGASCSSNVECNGGIIKTCPFCNFGTCKSTRPESPIVDAGVDAPAPSP